MWIELGDAMFNVEGLRSVHKVNGKGSKGQTIYNIALGYAESSPGHGAQFEDEKERDHTYNVLVKTLKCVGCAPAERVPEKPPEEAVASKPAMQIIRLGGVDFRVNDIVEIVAEEALPSITLWTAYTSGLVTTNMGTERVWDAMNGTRPAHTVAYPDVEGMTRDIQRVRDALKMMGFVETPGVYPKRWFRP